MAHAAAYTDLPRESAFRSLTRWLTSSVYAVAALNPRLQRVRRLQERSDAELGALGISRDQIVHHVFRDAYHR